jgi:hypothetical protein
MVNQKRYLPLPHMLGNRYALKRFCCEILCKVHSLAGRGFAVVRRPARGQICFQTYKKLFLGHDLQLFQNSLKLVLWFGVL